MKDLESDIKMNLVQEAIYIGEDALLDMSKSVISGFNPAVIFNEKITVNQDNLEKINFTYRTIKFIKTKSYLNDKRNCNYILFLTTFTTQLTTINSTPKINKTNFIEAK